MARQLTVRGVSSELARRLEELADSRGKSINSTVLEILESAAGIDGRRERLKRYVLGEEAEDPEFDASLKAQRQIDHDLWR